VAWSAPVLATAALVAVAAPRAPSAESRHLAAERRWWPTWRSKLLWRLGFVLGGANVAYWATNAFVPDFLTHIGRPEMIGETLTSLNLGQLPISLLLLFVSGRLTGRAWPFFVSGLVMLAGLLAMVATGAEWWIVLGAGAVGFSCAWTLIMALTLPPLICAPEEVAPTTAGMFVIGYSCSVAVPVIGGLLWDATGSPYFVFALIALGGLTALVLPWTIAMGARAPHAA